MATSDNSEQDLTPHNETISLDKKANFRRTSMWTVILTIYVGLLASVGYVAFWEQDFNKQEKVVDAYITILAKHKQAGGSQNLTEDELTVLIKELIVRQADTAGDIQDLASQSFNIILGAILAFLSASATMIFRNSDDEERANR